MTRPTEHLRDANLDDWHHATTHAFCRELADGSLPLNKMRNYLVQDYQFIDNFFRLAASAIHHAPNLPSRLPLAQFMGVLAGPENTYFQRSFDALDVAQEDRSSPKLKAPTRDFQNLMLKASKSGDYGAMVAVLCVAEWSYLEWATPFANHKPELPFYFAEWIDLHVGEYFESVVEHLRSQVDTAYDDANEAGRVIIAEYFAEAVRLERAFFDMSYE
jgi:thiaminase/transcriptional activator TenA